MEADTAASSRDDIASESYISRRLPRRAFTPPSRLRASATHYADARALSPLVAIDTVYCLPRDAHNEFGLRATLYAD